jgi:D-xylonolactonase
LSLTGRIAAPSTNIELVADYACEIGENPLWHEREQRLYWTDISRGKLYRYEPATGKHEQCYDGRPVGGFTIQTDGSLLLFMDRGTIAIWRDQLVTELIPEIPAEVNSRFNDVIADPRGRVFCGTMSTPDTKGSLYRLDPDATYHQLLKGIGCPNGMAFSLDHKSFFFTDSFAYEIYLFDYDVDTGNIQNRRTFARFTEADGMPDGMTIDREGNLWIAFWGGSKVVRLHPNAEVDRTISFPVLKTSSVTFAGTNYRDLYITTAGGESRAQDGALAGALFRLRDQVQGVPEFLSSIQPR